ncbi:MAG TPA: type II toxin-antitoxin system HicB family antitoxin [Verrucomicrobiae bacterium]|jgi:predicted RNase H-like HicB family nuclease
MPSENNYSMDMIWSGEDEAYLAQVRELPGCVADGKTPVEALQNLQIVVQEWLETAREEGRPVPPPRTLEMVDQHLMTAQQQLHEQVQNVIKETVQSILNNAAEQQASQNIPRVPSWREGSFADFDLLSKNK